MKSFVLFGLLIMAWGYYALSGGSNFVPEGRDSTTIFDTSTVTAQARPTDDAARAAALAAINGPVVPDAPAPLAPSAATAQTVAAPIFTSLAQRRENLAAIAAAEAATRAQTATETTLRPAAGAGADMRVVDASRVNLRDGPGTQFVAVDQLSNGTITEVLEYGPGNWVRIQVQGTTQSGWMSSNFLVTVN